jgi:AcrR family transcriptional regulator
MPYRAPDAANPRVQRTRDRMLAAARELLAEAGPAGLTYSVLAERAGVTRQTLYRHWPTRSSLLVALILEGGSADGYPEPGDDPAVVAAAWLASLRDGLRDQARRAAVVAVAAQADADPDSAQALAELAADRRAALNDLLQPSGVYVTPDEYPLLYGPVLAGIIFERAQADDDFIASVVAQWLAGRQADSTGQG